VRSTWDPSVVSSNAVRPLLSADVVPQEVFHGKPVR